MTYSATDHGEGQQSAIVAEAVARGDLHSSKGAAG
jgi:hypothetical protein